MLILELQAKLELNVSFASRLRAGDLAEVSILLVDVQAGGLVLRCVRNIRSFRAELQFQALRKGKVLEDGEIEGPSRRPNITLQPHIALREALRRSERGNRDEIGSVKPLIGSASARGRSIRSSSSQRRATGVRVLGHL